MESKTEASRAYDINIISFCNQFLIGRTYVDGVSEAVKRIRIGMDQFEEVLVGIVANLTSGM